MALKRRRSPDIAQMDDLQLLAHLIDLSGTELTAARELAHSLLDVCQTLGGVLALPPEHLLRYPGLSENAAVFLRFLPALMDRYGLASQEQSGRPVRLWDQGDLERLVLPHFYGQNVERVYAFCLDGNMNLITATLCAQGGSTAVSCSVRRVLELALNHRSKGVILAHNHPDGIPVFSKSDLMSTSALAQELAMVDIPLLDHLLLADGKLISLRKLAAAQKLPDPVYPLPKEWFVS